MKTLRGQIVDIFNQKIFKGEVLIENGRIVSVKEADVTETSFIMPGFVDAHVHIESSMLVPSEFARLAVVHGTVGTVSDPHEIGNVLGVKGVRYMIENGNQVPFKFNFGAPSCVPATSFETAGATINAADIDALLAEEQVRYLAEMMNYPGVLFNDPIVMEKLAIARKHGKPVDGHAPGLRGEDAKLYASHGISTDHECFTYEEAREKLELGMKILVREGSAAKNFEALIDLMNVHYLEMMFCSDDKHPDDLIEGHINQLVVRAIAKGIDLFKVLRAACVNPVLHYNLDIGLLREGDPADFIIVSDLEQFIPEKTFVDGKLVAENGKSFIQPVEVEILNNFNTSPKEMADFEVLANGKSIRVIEALDGELITNELIEKATEKEGFLISNPERDILKMTVVNRYSDKLPSMAFIKNFGLKSGAIASCVGHDSHNIIAVGVDDESLTRAVNLIIKSRGGICALDASKAMVLPLPIAGIMTNEDGYAVAQKYSEIDRFAKSLGSNLSAPFMTLSFMALLVIPRLKLSDLGLFDGKTFQFTDLIISE
ncbi:MAG: adenine deaminase [Bacteroidota bacterium]